MSASTARPRPRSLIRVADQIIRAVGRPASSSRVIGSATPCTLVDDPMSCGTVTASCTTSAAVRAQPSSRCRVAHSSPSRSVPRLPARQAERSPRRAGRGLCRSAPPVRSGCRTGLVAEQASIGDGGGLAVPGPPARPVTRPGPPPPPTAAGHLAAFQAGPGEPPGPGRTQPVSSMWRGAANRCCSCWRLLLCCQ